MKRKISTTLTLMMFILALIPVQNTSMLPMDHSTFENSAKQPSSSIKGVAAFIERDPIKIFNDSAFETKYPEFEGSGTTNDPYLIDGYNITYSGISIHIENTTKHFRINNSLLNPLGGDWAAIYMKNVTLTLFKPSG